MKRSGYSAASLVVASLLVGMAGCTTCRLPKPAPVSDVVTQTDTALLSNEAADTRALPATTPIQQVALSPGTLPPPHTDQMLPIHGAHLTAEYLVEQVLSRNPTVAEMVAA